MLRWGRDRRGIENVLDCLARSIVGGRSGVRLSEGGVLGLLELGLLLLGHLLLEARGDAAVGERARRRRRHATGRAGDRGELLLLLVRLRRGRVVAVARGRIRVRPVLGVMWVVLRANPVAVVHIHAAAVPDGAARP